MEKNNDITVKPTQGELTSYLNPLNKSKEWVLEIDGKMIGRIQSEDVGDEEAQANAAHIVKCVNNFDSVLEALKKTLAFIIDTGCESELIDETETIIKSINL